MKRQVHLSVGAYRASREGVVLATVLGSCVGVCLFDPVARIGGLNHILLPGAPDLKRWDAPARYGAYAMERLLNRILQLGGTRSKLMAKAFGGAQLLAGSSTYSGIGKRNAEFVVEFLAKERIPLVSQDLGGHDARSIRFHTDTGEVLLRRFRTRNLAEVLSAERRRLDRVRRQLEQPTDVTFFDPT